MALSQRMTGPILTNVSSTTLFAGVDEFERMRSLRGKITEVRRAWQSDDYFNELKSKIAAYTNSVNLSSKTLSKIKTLLAGYTDWADMYYGRPEEPQQGWAAIELYCSEEGYNLLFGIFNAALRNQKTEEEVLLVAAALVEFVTIELYNLRLSNIGDPHYANYQGTTFRGMCVSAAMATEYKKAASNPDLSKRHFGVPLGFTSSSTSKETTKEFIKQHPGEDQMHWIIHVHGLDPRLLKVYKERYPDSVVTSITAMPVGRIAELREKEILLRGAFFHIVSMESEKVDDRMIHTLQLVLMNTNRDHGTELALDEGSKQKQRDFFRDMIMASRFQICSELSKGYSNADSENYKELARTALKRIDAINPWEIAENPVLPDNTSNHLATWSGDMTDDSYPASYLALRRKFQKAAREGDWNSVREIIDGEYEWETAEWLNLPALEHPWTGRTLLHEMASHGPPQQGSTHKQSWHYLIEKVIECEVWSAYQCSFNFLLLFRWYFLRRISRRNGKECGHNANSRRNCQRKFFQ
jgi:hypothetical protein